MGEPVSVFQLGLILSCTCYKKIIMLHGNDVFGLIQHLSIVHRTMKSCYKLVTLFAVLVFNVRVTLQHSSLNPGKLKIVNLYRLRVYKLYLSPLTSLEVPDEMKCLASCVRSNDCYCVNTRKQANENVICELLNRTIHHYRENLTQDEISSHWYAMVNTLIRNTKFLSFSACFKRLLKVERFSHYIFITTQAKMRNL